jgi:hypothetical protein
MTSITTFLQRYRLDCTTSKVTSPPNENNSHDILRSYIKEKDTFDDKIVCKQSSSSDIQHKKKTIEEWDYIVIQMASAWH